MRIVIAGSPGRQNSTENACKDIGLSKLYSILNERTRIEVWDDDYFLMVDSGAHSWNKMHDHLGMKRNTKLQPADKFIEHYYNFIKKHKEKKVVWVEFDVYNDLPMEVIDDFYDRVMKLGISGKLLRVYHHYLDPEKGDYSTLQKWINQGQDYIGLGADNIDNFDDIFNMTKDTVKYHGFALTRLPIIEKYPFYSVDSTSPLSTVIFGRYTKPIMGFNERNDIFKKKSIECFHEDDERLRNALLETKKTEDYITKLWKKRGVKWSEIQW